MPNPPRRSNPATTANNNIQKPITAKSPGSSAAQPMPRHTAIHNPAQKLCEDICITILKINVPAGHDATTKVEKKAAALKATYHLLASFGQIRRPNFLALKQAE